MAPALDLDHIPSVKQMKTIMAEDGAADPFAFQEFKQWPFAVVPRDYYATSDPNWVKNDPRFASKTTIDEITNANDAFLARIKGCGRVLTIRNAGDDC